jgi:plastocyanin
MPSVPLTLLAALAALALCPSTAAPHAGHGAVFVSIGQFKYSPKTADAVTGDSVLWAWDGPERNHSVTADDGSFDSDPGKTDGIQHTESEGFAFRFDQPGTFTYHCKVHPSMTGKVVVTGQPAGTDTTRPEILALRARRSGRSARVSLSLSEAADFSVRLRRGGRTAVSRRFSGDIGEVTVRIPLKRVPGGRYTVLVIATDRAGNKSAPARTALRVK